MSDESEYLDNRFESLDDDIRELSDDVDCKIERVENGIYEKIEKLEGIVEKQADLIAGLLYTVESMGHEINMNQSAIKTIGKYFENVAKGV